MSGRLILSTVLAAVLLAPPGAGQRRAGPGNPAPDARPAESPGSQAAQLPEAEFKRWLKANTDLLTKLDKTLKGPWSQPIDVEDLSGPNAWQPKFTPAEQQAEDTLIKTLKEICLTYLRAGTGQRKSIRRMFDGRETALWYLRGYTSNAAGQIHSEADVEWLLVGLAAASIQDNRMDSRDTYMSLGRLYVSAYEAGIAPGPHFERVAGLSSREESAGGYGSMYEFLLGFEKSAFFKHEVVPQLARPKSPKPRA